MSPPTDSRFASLRSLPVRQQNPLDRYDESGAYKGMSLRLRDLSFVLVKSELREIFGQALGRLLFGPFFSRVLEGKS